MSNEGYTRNFRQSLTPYTPGSQALTTEWTKILEAQVTGDTRWIGGGSRVYNHSNAEDGGGPCDYDLAYVPIEIQDGDDITDSMLIGGTPVDARDYHQIGTIPVCPGYEVWGKADFNDTLNILIYTEDIE